MKAINTDVRLLSPTAPELFKELIKLFGSAFEMDSFIPPPESYLTEFLQNQHFLALAAFADGKIVGGLTAYILNQYYSATSQAYLYDLAFAPDHQRAGIGSALINHLLDHCASRGIEEVFVQADQGDVEAIEFYRSTKPDTTSPVLLFSYKALQHRR